MDASKPVMVGWRGIKVQRALTAEVPSKEICNSNARSSAEKNEHQKLEAECHLWKLHMFREKYNSLLQLFKNNTTEGACICQVFDTSERD